MSKYIPAVKITNTRFTNREVTYETGYSGTQAYNSFLDAYKKAVQMTGNNSQYENKEPVVLKEVQFKEVEE